MPQNSTRKREREMASMEQASDLYWSRATRLPYDNCNNESCEWKRVCFPFFSRPTFPCGNLRVESGLEIRLVSIGSEINGKTFTYTYEFYCHDIMFSSFANLSIRNNRDMFKVRKNSCCNRKNFFSLLTSKLAKRKSNAFSGKNCVSQILFHKLGSMNWTWSICLSLVGDNSGI